MKLSFKQSLYEASHSDKKAELISSYLLKNIQDLKRLPGIEEYSGEVSGWGLRFFYNNKSLRINFENSSNPTSIDVWDKKRRNADYRINLEGVNIKDSLESIVSLILNKNSKINESLLLENLEIVQAPKTSVTSKEDDTPLLDNVYEQQVKDSEDILNGMIKDNVTNAVFICGRGGTGKTFNVERVLKANGKKEDSDYARVAGSVTAPNIYKKLYDFKDGIVLFDDCDSALGDQESRNIIKGATDTKKVRAISWEKNASFVYNPNKIPTGQALIDWINKQDKKSRIPDEMNTLEKYPEYYIQCKQEEGLYPNKFNFQGKVIFISNLQLDELDPDRSIRTRAMVISVNPSDEDILKFMIKIAGKVNIDSGTLSLEERMEVIDVIKKSPKSLNMRFLQRGFNLKAAGFKNWEYLLSTYG